MLETRELYKVYKPKKGVAVTALNKVSLKFPEKEWFSFWENREAVSQHC